MLVDIAGDIPHGTVHCVLRWVCRVVEHTFFRVALETWSCGLWRPLVTRLGRDPVFFNCQVLLRKAHAATELWC